MNRRRRTRPKGNENSTTSQGSLPSLPSSSTSRPAASSASSLSGSSPQAGGGRPVISRRGVGMRDDTEPDDDPSDSKIINNNDCAESATPRRRYTGLVMWGVLGLVGIATASVVVPILLKSRAETHHASTTTTSTATASPSSQPNELVLASIGSFELLETVPHDSQAFTQGLGLINSTHCYESTGLHGQSSVRIVEIATGRVTLQQSVPDRFFGEGLTSYRNHSTSRDELVQITWQEKRGFVYDAVSLQRLRTFRYDTFSGEGWGITTCPSLSGSAAPAFLVSDGSHYLMTWNASFQEVSRVAVTIVLPSSFRTGSGAAVQDGDKPVKQYLRNLNELEYDPHTDTVLANVWFKDWVIRINPTTGVVVALYELDNLYPPQDRAPGTDVLNGIAVTDEPGVVWVTGKLWPNMYRIRLVDP